MTHTRDEQYLPRKCSCAACQGPEGLGGRSPNPETRESYPLHMGCPWTGSGWQRLPHNTPRPITNQHSGKDGIKGKKKKKHEHKEIAGGNVSKVMEKYGMNGKRENEG